MEMAPNPSGSLTREDADRGLQSIEHQQHSGVTRWNGIGLEGRRGDQPAGAGVGRNEPRCAQGKQRTSSSSKLLPLDRREPCWLLQPQRRRNQPRVLPRWRLVERGQGRDQTNLRSARTTTLRRLTEPWKKVGWMDGSLDFNASST